MKVSAIVTVLIASSAFVAGAALERATHAAPVSAAAAPVQVGAAARKVAPQRSANLVVLPEVTVRPSAEDIALAYAQPVAAANVPDSPLPQRSGAGRGSFDMPYYSFGKVLPQVSQD